MTRNRASKGTLVGTLGFLGLLLSSPLGEATSPERSEPALATAGFADTIGSHLQALGVQPAPHAWEQIESLGRLIDDAVGEIVTAQGGPLPKLIPPFNVEGCSGQGSCGGTHKDDQGRYYYWVMSGNYTQGDVCSNNEFILVTQVGENSKACYQVQQTQFCVSANCTRLDPDQPVSMQLDRIKIDSSTGAENFLLAVTTPATESGPPSG